MQARFSFCSLLKKTCQNSFCPLPSRLRPLLRSLPCLLIPALVLFNPIWSNSAQADIRTEIKAARKAITDAENKLNAADQNVTTFAKGELASAKKAFQEAEATWNSFRQKTNKKEADLLDKSGKVSRDLENAFVQKEKFHHESKTFKKWEEEILRLVREGDRISDEQKKVIDEDVGNRLRLWNDYDRADDDLSHTASDFQKLQKKREKAFAVLARARENLSSLRERAPELLEEEAPPFLETVDAVSSGTQYYHRHWISNPLEEIENKIKVARKFLEKNFEKRDKLISDKSDAFYEYMEAGRQLRTAEGNLYNVVKSIFWYDLWLDFTDKTMGILMDARTMGPWAIVVAAGGELVDLGLSYIIPSEKSDLYDLSNATKWEHERPQEREAGTSAPKSKVKSSGYSQKCRSGEAEGPGDSATVPGGKSNSNDLSNSASGGQGQPKAGKEDSGALVKEGTGILKSKGIGTLKSVIQKFVESGTGASAEIIGTAGELHALTIERIWADGSKTYKIVPALKSFSFTEAKDGLLHNPEGLGKIAGFTKGGAVGFITGYVKKKNIDIAKKEMKKKIIESHRDMLEYLDKRSIFVVTGKLYRYYSRNLNLVNDGIKATNEVLDELLDELEKEGFKRCYENDVSKNIDKEKVNLTLTFNSEMDDVIVSVKGDPLPGSLAGKVWTGILDNSRALEANLSVSGVDINSQKKLDGDPSTIARLAIGGNEKTEFISYEETDDRNHTLTFDELGLGEGNCIKNLLLENTFKNKGDYFVPARVRLKNDSEGIPVDKGGVFQFIGSAQCLKLSASAKNLNKVHPGTAEICGRDLRNRRTRYVSGFHVLDYTLGDCSRGPDTNSLELLDVSAWQYNKDAVFKEKIDVEESIVSVEEEIIDVPLPGGVPFDPPAGDAPKVGSSKTKSASIAPPETSSGSPVDLQDTPIDLKQQEAPIPSPPVGQSLDENEPQIIKSEPPAAASLGSGTTAPVPDTSSLSVQPDPENDQPAPAPKFSPESPQPPTSQTTEPSSGAAVVPKQSQTPQGESLSQSAAPQTQVQERIDENLIPKFPEYKKSTPDSNVGTGTQSQGSKPMISKELRDRIKSFPRRKQTED